MRRMFRLMSKTRELMVAMVPSQSNKLAIAWPPLSRMRTPNNLRRKMRHLCLLRFRSQIIITWTTMKWYSSRSTSINSLGHKLRLGLLGSQYRLSTNKKKTTKMTMIRNHNNKLWASKISQIMRGRWAIMMMMSPQELMPLHNNNSRCRCSKCRGRWSSLSNSPPIEPKSTPTSMRSLPKNSWDRQSRKSSRARLMSRSKLSKLPSIATLPDSNNSRKFKKQ